MQIVHKNNAHTRSLARTHTRTHAHTNAIYTNSRIHTRIPAGSSLARGPEVKFQDKERESEKEECYYIWYQERSTSVSVAQIWKSVRRKLPKKVISLLSTISYSHPNLFLFLLSLSLCLSLSPPPYIADAHSKAYARHKELKAIIESLSALCSQIPTKNKKHTNTHKHTITNIVSGIYINKQIT